ncbi:hypothetical protein B0H15DRAFT_867589 [Mycena belliarum]|uniref:Uncharacterized protein n=1 Tax=Mycena belliarum TaxID=1033014 RepID=A0AAD6TNT5_9AGAR|nr:hypothetical protein B0H15DRAFT_867589 [Mycena belliae]
MGVERCNVQYQFRLVVLILPRTSLLLQCLLAPSPPAPPCIRMHTYTPTPASADANGPQFTHCGWRGSHACVPPQRTLNAYPSLHMTLTPANYHRYPTRLFLPCFFVPCTSSLSLDYNQYKENVCSLIFILVQFSIVVIACTWRPCQRALFCFGVIAEFSLQSA